MCKLHEVQNLISNVCILQVPSKSMSRSGDRLDRFHGESPLLWFWKLDYFIGVHFGALAAFQICAGKPVEART